MELQGNTPPPKHTWNQMGSCFEGQGGLVSRLIRGVTRVTIWVIGLLTYLLSPPDPPSILHIQEKMCFCGPLGGCLSVEG